MPSAVLQRVIQQGYDARRNSLVRSISAILGKNPVAGYLPHRNDILTSVCPWSGRVWTADASMAGQITPLGFGSQRSFDGTNNYLATPDADALSPGNGTTDTAWSFVTVTNVTNTAAVRMIFSKNGAGFTQGEYLFSVNGSDFLEYDILDASASSVPLVLSNAVITQGSWHTLGATYSAATGGATAANDMTLYQDGLSFASTATNSATYVAMENNTNQAVVGGRATGTSTPFQGAMACCLVIGSNVTAAQHLALYNLLRGFYGF